jgi:hypothetical protein
MKKATYSLIVLPCILILSAVSYGQDQAGAEINQLTQEELKEGWVLLFDGNTSVGWRGANKAGFPEKGWKIHDGILSVTGEKGGDIITEKKYADFDLRLEFRVREQRANSGIKYYVLENGYREGSTLGLEFQTANGHPGERPKTALGSLYDILPVDEEALHPAPNGEWNQVRIVSNNNRVEHWLNGYKVLEYERGGKAFRKGISESKFRDIKDFGEAEEGHILLQDHNYEVSFRNIKIREF